MISRLCVATLLVLLSSCSAARVVQLDTGEGSLLEYRPTRWNDSVAVDEDDFEESLSRLLLDTPLAIRPAQAGWLVRASYPGSDTGKSWQHMLRKGIGGLCAAGQPKEDRRQVSAVAVVEGNVVITLAPTAVAMATGQDGPARSGGGASAVTNYRETFFAAHPTLRDKVVVHHADGAEVAMSQDRWVLSPEVAGELGENTVMDSSVHPPKVSRLHHRFEGWLGDDLIEVFPCFLVTSHLAAALEEAGLTGFSLDVAEVSGSPEFQELFHRSPLPEFRWLKIIGQDGHADFQLTPDFRLEVSSRALEVLRKFSISHAVLETAEN